MTTALSEGAAWGLVVGALLAIVLVFAGLGHDVEHDRRIFNVLAAGGLIVGTCVGVLVHLLST